MRMKVSLNQSRSRVRTLVAAPTISQPPASRHGPLSPGYRSRSTDYCARWFSTLLLLCFTSARPSLGDELQPVVTTNYIVVTNMVLVTNYLARANVSKTFIGPLRVCFKNGTDRKSGQTAQLNSDHGDINPCFGAGDRTFVVAH